MPTQSDEEYNTYVSQHQDDQDLDESEVESKAKPDQEGSIARLSQKVDEISTRLENTFSETLNGIDFVVDMAEIINTDPPVYRLYIAGHGILEVKSTTLLNRGYFRRRYMELFRTLPKVPTKEKEWEQYVGQWLAQAVVVDMPPESSEEGRRRELVEAALRNTSRGESRGDLLDKGKWLEIDGRRAYRLESIRKLVAKDDSLVTQQNLSTLLRDMGFASEQKKVLGRNVRVWIAPGGFVEELIGDDASSEGLPRTTDVHEADEAKIDAETDDENPEVEELDDL